MSHIKFKKGCPVSKVRRKLAPFVGDEVAVTAEHFNRSVETRCGTIQEESGHLVLMQDDGHEIFLDTLIAEMKITDRVNTLVSVPVRRYEVVPLG
jgi:hypothetical protein